MTPYEKYNLVFQIIAVVLIIIGWFAVFWFNLRQQRKQLKDDAKMKIYNELWSLRKYLQESLSKSSAIIQSKPFILMDSTAILGSVTKNEQDIRKGEGDAWRHWSEYLADLSSKNNNFNEIYLDFWRSIEMWIHIMPELEIAKDILFSEYSILNEKISKYYSFLQSLNVQKWREWNQKEIDEKSTSVWGEIMNISCYTEDMMGLILTG